LYDKPFTVKKTILLLAMLCALQILTAQTTAAYKVIPLITKESFYLNGGGRALLGGKSRNYLMITLHSNTVEWYYAVTTTPNQSQTPDIGLTNQLVKLLTPSGIVSSLVSSLIAPTGAGVCDIYLFADQNELNKFVGKQVPVGGLTGQPIGNYLLPKWIPDMKADPLSLKLTSCSVAPIKARFEWNRRMAWSPQQLPWPPKGMEVTFTYKADAAIMSNLVSDISRKVLLSDNFLSLSPNWDIIKGPAAQNASFHNEGKAGEMLTAANSVLFAEQPLPPETKVIICELNGGTDVSDEYGSGIALQFADGRSSKFHLAPNAKRFRVFHDSKRATFEGYVFITCPT